MAAWEVVEWGSVARLATPTSVIGRDGKTYAVLHAEPTGAAPGWLGVTVLDCQSGAVSCFMVVPRQRVRALVPDLGDALVALAAQFKIEFIEE
jgi:hypothetical protein